MTSFKVSFAEGVWPTLKRRLTQSAPIEDGAFLLATWAPGHLTILAEVQPPELAWDGRSEVFLKPSTAYLNRAAAAAEREDAIPVFLHTHPMGWADFSDADEDAHDGWCPFFAKHNSHKGFASLVWGMTAWSASLWLDGKRLDTREVHAA